MRLSTGLRRVLGALLVSSVALVLVTPALGGTLTASATSCSGQVFGQPFLPWLDPDSYTLAPNGGFESTGVWTLAGGAKRVSGNEPFKVHGANDRYSLALPSGSSATTRAMCVGINYPTLRLFASNSGSALSTLKVEVLFEDLSGNVLSLTVATITGGSTWQPTLPIAFLANVPGSLLATTGTGTTAVAFRFTPQGTSGNWRIDDVYVYPFKGR